jgi:hypothetical protein
LKNEGGKDMKSKIICILVLTLLITTALPVVGLMNIGHTKKTESNEPQPLATVTGYFSVPAAAFQPWASTMDYRNLGHEVSGDGYFWAPVYIPNTATVTKLDFYWADLSASEDARLRLIRYEIGSVSTTEWLAEVDSYGDSGHGVSTDDTIDYPIIDNKLYCYFLWVNIPEYLAIVLKNVNIEYTIVIGSGSGEVIAENGQTQVS